MAVMSASTLQFPLDRPPISSQLPPYPTHAYVCPIQRLYLVPLHFVYLLIFPPPCVMIPLTHPQHLGCFVVRNLIVLDLLGLGPTFFPYLRQFILQLTTRESAAISHTLWN